MNISGALELSNSKLLFVGIFDLVTLKYDGIQRNTANYVFFFSSKIFIALIEIIYWPSLKNIKPMIMRGECFYY